VASTDPESATEHRDWTMIEVAQAKGVAYQTVWRAISRGLLPSRRVGRTVLIPPEAVAAWVPCYDRVPRRFRGQPRMPRPQARRAGPRRALVADDEPAIRTLLAQIIEEEGISVVSVGDGEAALAQAQLQPFSHIFLDVRMPRQDGASVLPQIRAACPNAVIAFVTAHPSDLAKVQWPAAWPIVVIPKPFDLDQIVDVLRLSVDDRPSRRKRGRKPAATSPQG
jgi:excisionase family DNA binding protein